MLRNEPEAWDKFASVWGKVLLRFFRSKGLGQQSAEDAVQEVMRKLFVAMSRDQFERDGKKKKLKHFVFMIARQQFANQIERFEVKPGSPGGSDFREHLAAIPGENESDEFEACAVSVLLDAVKNEVGEENWQAFYWRYFDNLPHNEIGERLGISGATARVRVHRIRERIRQELEAEIVDEA